MTRVDLSLPISPTMLTWPGDPAVTLTRRLELARDGANVSELMIGTHTGTHVDPPAHFIDGAPGIDQVSLEQLCGPALVVDARGHHGELGAADMDTLQIPDGTERILLKSDNSEIWANPSPSFPDVFTCLNVDAARWVVAHGIRVVGTDFLGIEKRGAEGHPVHVELLSHGVIIVEGLDLRAVHPGPGDFTCLPLRLVDGDGGPSRAFLDQEVATPWR